jgi:hypothetical protein
LEKICKYSDNENTKVSNSYKVYQTFIITMTNARWALVVVVTLTLGLLTSSNFVAPVLAAMKGSHNGNSSHKSSSSNSNHKDPSTAHAAVVVPEFGSVSAAIFAIALIGLVMASAKFNSKVTWIR